ncbi:hypothetical protein [Synechocystis salina]|uniref:Uncharacterized protein n=1 Tax=Synechocystis salina LEGE 00031 TaxID=1828736 RepID=A0ABR9VS32_9SYNC|nr:hypothetical protein [Synechocystis salina]MBE9241674.1 hypothetical protein [Synechocystis salina LEGE 00041]MBE9254132.1 hypothetical protein [Synechocystis salina LEGE 00031]
MFINRVHLSKIIGTKPSNIRKTKKVNNEIIIHLWDSDKIVRINFEEYEDFIKKSQGSTDKSDYSLKQQSFGAILLLAGLAISLIGVNMNTSAGSTFGRSSNFNKINNQNTIGGFVFLSGIILIATSKS